MTHIKKFDYEGHAIAFEFADGNKMLNATQMALAFGKRAANFLRLKETKEYVILLESRYSHVSFGKHAGTATVLRIVKGGTPELQGTWMDEKLALKFAAWLSPEFELWVYDRIHELFTTGKTELQISPTQNIIQGLRLITDQLEIQEKDIHELKDNVGEIKEYVSDLEAKIISIDKNYYSVSGYCALHSIDCPLDKARDWGYRATKISKQTHRPIGKAYDAKYGEINTYHVDILKQVVV